MVRGWKDQLVLLQNIHGEKKKKENSLSVGLEPLKDVMSVESKQQFLSCCGLSFIGGERILPLSWSLSSPSYFCLFDLPQIKVQPLQDSLYC